MYSRKDRKWKLMNTSNRKLAFWKQKKLRAYHCFKAPLHLCNPARLSSRFVPQLVSMIDVKSCSNAYEFEPHFLQTYHWWEISQIPHKTALKMEHWDWVHGPTANPKLSLILNEFNRKTKCMTQYTMNGVRYILFSAGISSHDFSISGAFAKLFAGIQFST